MNIRLTLSIFSLVILAAGATWGSHPSIGPEKIVSSQDFDEFKPQIAYNSNHDEYLVVWHDTSPLQSRSVMGKRVTNDGSTIEEFIIAFEDMPPRDNGQPTVAYDPANDLYLVAWVRDVFGDGSDWDVYGRIVLWDGPVAGNSAFVICSFSSKQWNPRAAFAGTQGDFLVTWWNEGTGGVNSYISAQRVSPAGNLTGTNFLVASGPEERVVPDVAYNQARNEYLVVYQLMDGGFGSIYGVRISGSGVVLGGGEFGIAVWPDPETEPRVAASRVANEWAVVWQSDVAGSLKEVYARRVWVDGTGTVQTAAPVHIEGTSIDERHPDIAAHPESREYLISWEQQYSNSSGPFGIFASTLNTSNLLGPRFPIREPYSGLTSGTPGIAASPTNWFVAWEQERDDIPSYQDIHARAVYGPFFMDGFESGNFSGWSETTP